MKHALLRGLWLSVCMGSMMFTGGACKKEATSVGSSSGQTPTLNVRPDSELYAGNVEISQTLQQEIKRQFLQAVQNTGVLKHLAGENSNVWLSEIGIARTEKALLDIDATVDGRVAVRKRARGSTDGEANDSPLGVNVQTNYHLQTSSYNISFAFQERVSSTSEGQVIHLQLSKPLVIEENIKISSRIKLNLSAIKALPPAVGTIVARFFDDISMSLDSGVSFERTSDLSTRMYFRSAKGNMTELMRDMVADIGIPLCRKISALRGDDGSACAPELPTIDNPVVELEKRMSTPVLRIKSCEKTSVTENTLPIYKLSFSISPRLQIFMPNSKAYLYEKMGVSWKKLDWATVLGVNTKATCKLSSDSTNKCITLKYGKHYFDATCDGINKGSKEIGVKDEDLSIVY